MTEEEKLNVEVRDNKREDDHTVFIGTKPFMNYVTGVVMQFTTQGANEVLVKARGRFISEQWMLLKLLQKDF